MVGTFNRNIGKRTVIKDYEKEENHYVNYRMSFIRFKRFRPYGQRSAADWRKHISIFYKESEGGSAKALNLADVEAYLAFASQNGFGKILAHAPYTLNACAAAPSVREFAFKTMAEDLERMEQLPHNYYNFHPGSHVKQGVDIGIEKIAEVLNSVLKPEQTTLVLLETMSGKGSEVGSTFEELRRIIELVTLKEKMGICLDTCHVYDAGYDIVNDLDGVLEEFDRIIGLDRLKAVHLNDSKNPFKSHKDRHEKIGAGSIGLEATMRIINHPKLRHLPFYLETPNELEGYADEIRLLKAHYQAD